MPLEVPNLDDRTFADLVEEALSLLPQYAPLWTNYNPSDPGITLIELLAYFTEMLIYRLNRVTRESQLRFLQLLRGTKWEQALKTARRELSQSRQAVAIEDFEDPARQATREELEQALKTAVQELRQPRRAVTAEDFEYLAHQATQNEPAGRQVVRAHCFFGRNLDRIAATAWDRNHPGHVSVVIVPHGGCDLRLMSVDTVDGLVKEGSNLIIVAFVGTHLHIRIFDATGKRVIDKVENQLTSGDTLTTLKKRLTPLPNESGLSPEQKQKIIQDATSIAGHTPHCELDPAALKSLVKRVHDWLEPRCLLTTRLHVSPPHYLWVSLGAVIHLQGDTPGDAVRQQADAELQRFFNPLPGAGPHGEGWPFGRNIYLSEVTALLDQVPGVDYVEEVRVLRLATSEAGLHRAGAAVGIQIGIHSTVGVDSRLGTVSGPAGERLLRNESGTPAAVALRPYELVKIRLRAEDILIHGGALQSQQET